MIPPTPPRPTIYVCSTCKISILKYHLWAHSFRYLSGRSSVAVVLVYHGWSLPTCRYSTLFWLSTTMIRWGQNHFALVQYSGQWLSSCFSRASPGWNTLLPRRAVVMHPLLICPVPHSGCLLDLPSHHATSDGN